MIVNFWGPSCVPCREEFPLFSSKLEEHADDASWPTVIDPDESMQNAYLTLARPTSYFIDADGVLQSIQIGELRDEDFERQYALIAP